jgi:hypothetical protein
MRPHLCIESRGRVLGSCLARLTQAPAGSGNQIYNTQMVLQMLSYIRQLQGRHACMKQAQDDEQNKYKVAEMNSHVMMQRPYLP